VGATAEQSYVFRAMTPQGGTTFGLRAASDEGRLAEQLRRENLLLLRAWRIPGGMGEPSRLPLKDEAALHEQIAVLQGRGVTLVEALEVSASVVSARSRPRVEQLRELVASGAGFASACEQVGGVDDVTIAVYRSAEQTGDMAGAARRLCDAARRRLAIAGKAITVLIYPLVVLVVAIGLLTVLMTFVVPMVSERMASIPGMELPWFSAAVFAVGDWMRGNLGWLGVGVGAVVVLVVLARRLVFTRLRALATHVPVVKSLLLTTEMTRFFSVMAAMTKSGVTLADALGTATGVITDTKLRTQLEKLRQNLVEGGVLRSLIEKVDALPLATRRLLIAAERGGDLDSAFDTLADDMAQEVDKKAARLLALLEPAVILLMFAIIAPVIIAIAVPMLTIPTDLGGGGTTG
jgi:type II secretory pathway component PulF